MEHSAGNTADSRQPVEGGFGRRSFLAGAGALAGLGLTAALPGSPAARAATTGTSSETSQWRPSVCFTPERNWMNDPNGMVYFKGEYHLFFQHNPYGDQWGNMSWGHAVSTDLVHWKQLPVALEPDELGAIFSGCAVVDHHDTSGLFGGGPGLVALYTSAGDTQQQSLAYSSDRGRTWTKYSGNPVIPNSGEADFRDPKVFWHAPTSRWVMSIAVGDRIRFYGSPNLLQWEQLSEFGANHGAHGGVWECPDLFQLPVDGDHRRGKWVLIVSINPGGPAGGSGMQYFLGDFDGTTFTADGAPGDVLWADEGADFYAAVSWSDVPDGRRLWLGWMSNWSYAADIPTSPWRGGMSVPRELGLVSTAAGTRLAQQPVRELERVRRNRRTWKGTVSEQGGAPDTEGTVLDIAVEFRLTGATATSFGFDVFADGSHRTRIGYDVTTQELFVDRRHSGQTTVHTDFPAKHTVALTPVDDVLRIRIVLDRANVQVFGDRGQAVITDLVFPDGGSTRASTFATGGEVAVPSLEVFDLDA
ncbi:glycoside hydrolase family 32 protein [Prauserella alba]|uniref:Fructan beta-fructosidase n=1 Tax=Prauserella alba TaxID=176898 RepID=A0ABP4GDA0_9PSEU|nr:glycoside hydrolase family 32 protein [Prauserella alba]MCP2180654.1 fructan beta-fructosidase [Prauserella alba]